MKGKLIVLEGTDGSGKSTQLRTLCRHLSDEAIPFRQVEFPRYENLSSGPVRMYLDGAFGSDPADVNAYAASTFYAVDRYASYKQDWEDWYRSGGLVVCGRYTTANAIHQAAKLPPEQQEDFFHWLYDLEFGRLGLPMPDLVLWLDIPVEVAVPLLRQRAAANHVAQDIHERDLAYLSTCCRTARRAADALGWQRIPCAAQGVPRPAQAIHQEIWTHITPLLSDKVLPPSSYSE